jgi:hypothetical protein
MGVEPARKERRMEIWRLFSIGSGRERIGTLEALADFLSREASLIAQKPIVDYVHMKTRLSLNEFTREQLFRDAFDASRAASYAAVLGDLVAVVESHLRAAAGPRSGALPAALTRLFRECLGRFDVPMPSDPDQFARDLERRLAQLQMAAPKSSADMALTCGNAVYDLLPIHPRLRKDDREPVVEGVRFFFMSRCQRLGERLDKAALVAALLGEGAAAAPRTA